MLAEKAIVECLWNIKQLSSYLGVSPSTIRRWNRDPDNKFPQPIRLGRSQRWRLSDIKQFLEEPEE